mgnify:FL=1
MTPRLKVLVPSLLVVALVLGACSSHDSHSGSMTMTTVKVPADAPENGADVMFAQMMLVHHQQAVEMADDALRNSTNPKVVALATKIRTDQTAEIAQMTALLEQWGQPVPDAMHGAHMMAMEGMVSDADMQQLSTLTGTDFDRAFLTAMIAHHKGAIAMTNTELTDGKYPELKKLAASMAVAQQNEIDQMKGFLIALG